jgi:DNA-binding response OmpR family regulator
MGFLFRTFFMMPFILLIVAESAWAEHLKQTLFARDGMRIVLAQDGPEAQQKARFAPPNLVITKRHLPSGSGDDLCRWFRSNTELKDTRIVVMLETEVAAEAKLARDAGADQVIVQPRSPEALTPLVAQIVNAPMRQEIRVPVEVRVEGETSMGALQGLTRNLSLSGAMLEVSSAKAEKGDTLYVRLHPHGIATPIVAKAEVMRVSQQQMVVYLGVRFTRFDKDGRERLEQFLSQVVL